MTHSGTLVGKVICALAATAGLQSSAVSAADRQSACVVYPQGPQLGALFTRFPIQDAWHGTPKRPDVRYGEPHQYRTVIRDQAKKGPNFAGHLIVIAIGCGAGASCYAFVDARSGHAWFEPKLREVADTFQPRPLSDRLQFRSDSRLLVAGGAVNEADARTGLSYYEWTGRVIRLIGFYAADRLCPTSDRDLQLHLTRSR